MSYEDFKESVYKRLKNYKKEELKVLGNGIYRGVEHDCLFPKPYCDAKTPVMFYEGEAHRQWLPIYRWLESTLEKSTASFGT